MTRSPATHNNGFTLLEMLVVLVLIGLLTALVAQAIGGLGAIDASLERAERRVQQDYLVEHQLRKLAAGLVPDPNLDHAFAGDARSFSALSLVSLAARPGVPLPVRLTIASGPGGTDLILQVPAVSTGSTRPSEWMALQRWPLGPGDWVWRYRDKQDEWHSSWPETAPEAASEPQLPQGLALVEATSDSPRWLLAVPAHPVPRPEFQPFE